jgi:hypothetical protein
VRVCSVAAAIVLVCRFRTAIRLLRLRLQGPAVESFHIATSRERAKNQLGYGSDGFNEFDGSLRGPSVKSVKSVKSVSQFGFAFLGSKTNQKGEGFKRSSRIVLVRRFRTGSRLLRLRLQGPAAESFHIATCRERAKNQLGYGSDGFNEFDGSLRGPFVKSVKSVKSVSQFGFAFFGSKTK